MTEVFRQAAASRIIINAHRINQGLTPDLSAPAGDTDFYFVAAQDPETAVQRILELVKTRIPKRFGLNAIRDIQVLCPMNRGGVGARSLNIELQAALNPAGERKVERFGSIFAPGDKVMQIENDYDKEVYNGDIGYVVDVDPDAGELVASFDGHSATYGFGELDTLIPAYAATIHKSQGSEYPAVIIPVMTQHYPMLQRNLLYAGVTRGKKLVVLVGQKKAVAIAVRNVSGRRRWSKVDDWLRLGASRAPLLTSVASGRACRSERWVTTKRAPGQDVPSASAVRRSLIVANSITRSAASAGLSSGNSSSSVSRVSASLSARSRSSRARWVRISSAENSRRTSETNSRKLPGEGRMVTGGAGEIHQFLADRIVERGLEPIALSYASRRFALLDPNLMALGRSHRLALAAVGLSERQIISRAERDGNDWFRPASLFPRMIASAIVLRSRRAGRRRGNVCGDPQRAMRATAGAARKGQAGEGLKRTPAAGRQVARARVHGTGSQPRRRPIGLSPFFVHVAATARPDVRSHGVASLRHYS